MHAGHAGARWGWTSVVDASVLEPYGPPLAKVAEMRRLDLRRINHPIPDRSVIDDHRYDDIVAAIDEHRSRGAVYVHCWGGVGP